MPSYSTSNKNVNSAQSNVKSEKIRLVNGPKPLLKYKFYLDLRNQSVSTKIEAKIRQFGGGIELFFDRNVTHLITDQNIHCDGGSDGLIDKARNITGKQCVVGTPCTPSQTSSTTVLSNDSINSTVDSPFPTTTTPETYRKKPRSRADAMLERVRQQTKQSTNNTCSISPIENARRWGIPIWSVEKILNWLPKIAKVLQNSNKSKNLCQKTLQLKPPFIKFEPIARDARPVYKQLQIWPTIDLNAKKGVSPFIVAPAAPVPDQKQENENSKKMIRKTRISLRSVKLDESPGCAPPIVTNTATAAQQQSGYCEICRVEYQDLSKHARSETHLSYVRDDANFLSLDSLITAGANVEAFLRLNGNNKSDETFGRRSSSRLSNLKNQIEIKINGDLIPKKFPEKLTNNLVPPVRITRSSSACEKTHPDLSPAPISPAALSDSVHHLRSRGQLWLPSNLLGTTAEDDGNPVKPLSRCNENRSSCNNLLTVVKNECQDDSNSVNEIESEDEIPLLKRQLQRFKTKTKRPTPDDRLLLENRAYYKVEVLSSKLRSSTAYKDSRIHSSDQENTKKRSNQGTPNDRLVVKFRRVRRSELSTLSNEAENFMFPSRRGEDESTTTEDDECETDEERNTTADSSLLESSELKTSELNSEESSCESTDSRHRRRKQRRRRTHAEVFIQDNEKYYKFETPGSRLRFQGSFLPLMAGHSVIEQASAAGASSPSIKTEIKEEIEQIRETDFTKYKTLPLLNNISFIFERLPEQNYEILRKNQLNCIERDFQLYMQMHCPEFVPCPLPYEMNIPITPRDPQMCKDNFQKYLERITQPTSADNSEVNSTVDALDVINEDQLSNGSSSKQSSVNGGVRKRRSKKVFDSKNPRKSPRQHASTLAILSGLLHHPQRSRRSTKSGSEGGGDQDILLSPINEEDTSRCQSPAVASATAITTNSIGKLDIENFVVTEDDIAAIDNIVIEKDLFDENEFNGPDNRLLNVLNTYQQSKVLEVGKKEKWTSGTPMIRCGIFQGNYSLFTPKEFRRKGRRKKNKTGWPNNKRRVLSRRHIVHDETHTSTVNTSCIKSDTTIKRRGRKRKWNTVLTNSEPTSEFVDEQPTGSRSNTSRNSSDCIGFTPEECSAAAEKWNANYKSLNKKLSASKLSATTTRRNSVDFQPYVKVQKLEDVHATVSTSSDRQLRSSSPVIKRIKKDVSKNVTPPSSPPPLSPRKLRKPRGRWYRDR